MHSPTVKLRFLVWVRNDLNGKVDLAIREPPPGMEHIESGNRADGGDTEAVVGKRCLRVEAVVAGQDLPFEADGDRVRVRLPVLEEFESLLFELEA